MLTLYRGDSLYNLKSKPGRYRSEGITSSAFGAGGNPENIEKISLLQTVKQHIDHILEFEKAYFKISDFISFSDDLETAKLWAAGRSKEPLVPCTLAYRETRYVFRMVIPDEDRKEIAPGISIFRFACNTDLKNSNVPSDYHFLMLRYSKCAICESKSKNHSLVLIRPSAFGPLVEGAFDRAIRLADKNSEWLVLPTDPLPASKHRCTRIQPADFWNAEHYILPSDPDRDPFFTNYGYRDQQ